MVTAIKHVLTNSDGFPVERTCAAAVEILKNKVLTLSDPMTVAEVSAASLGAGYIFGGISAMDKDSTDASTKLTVWTDGTFKVYASGNITVGAAIKSVGTGYFAAAAASDYLSGMIAGYSLETAATGETFFAHLRAP